MSIRVGILGATRGLEFARAARRCGVAAEFTAVCDGYAPLLGKVKASLPELGFEPAYYTDYTGMLEETGIDAVIVANSATDHAQMAIAALERGIHVLSEVLPAQTPAQAVALVEAVERSGRHYAYAENYCYFRANLEAAMLCNHTKKATGDWDKARQRYTERRDKAVERLARYEEQVREYRNALAALRREAKRREAEAKTPERAKAVKARYAKRIATARRRADAADLDCRGGTGGRLRYLGHPFRRRAGIPAGLHAEL